MNNIVLASASPRRKELLSQLCLSFDVIPAESDETFYPSLSIEENIVRLALGKAKALEDSAQPDKIIIGADTVVCLDGKVLGKPASEDEAFSMLKALSGRTHHVYTGFALIRKRDGKQITGYEKTEVSFYHISDDDINAYIKTTEPHDKAGAYGIQGMGAVFVKGISGDYSNVVGLPLSRIAKALGEFGVRVFK
jgi:septum formation protein